MCLTELEQRAGTDWIRTGEERVPCLLAVVYREHMSRHGSS